MSVMGDDIEGTKIQAGSLSTWEDKVSAAILPLSQAHPERKQFSLMEITKALKGDLKCDVGRGVSCVPRKKRVLGRVSKVIKPSRSANSASKLSKSDMAEVTRGVGAEVHIAGSKMAHKAEGKSMLPPGKRKIHY